jgi:DNA-binding transcriptional LysR family regulator
MISTGVDLQLLRVLCAIVETRSVSRAGLMLGISQPAASYSLGRLRESLNDPLFVKTAAGMSPTPRTLAVYQEVRRGLDLLDSALSPLGFDPEKSDRNFRLAMSDIGEMVFLPPILQRLRKLAPRVGIEIRQVALSELPRALDFGDIDFGIGNLPEVCSETSYLPMFREHYVCMLRRDHATIKDKLSRKLFEEADHIIVASPFTGHHSVERSLLERGIKRKPTLWVPHFTSVPNVVAQTNLLVIAPSRVARAFAKTHGLRSLPLPVRVPPFEVRVHWSIRHETNEGHRWMRDTLASVLRGL